MSRISSDTGRPVRKCRDSSASATANPCRRLARPVSTSVRPSSSRRRFCSVTRRASRYATLLIAIGYTTRIGRHATITDIGVTTSTGKPSSADVTAQPAARLATVRTSRRAPPMLTLSMTIIDTSSTLGSRLNCITATHIPLSAASSVRLRTSARRGSAARSDTYSAACGHTNAFTAAASHHP